MPHAEVNGQRLYYEDSGAGDTAVDPLYVFQSTESLSRTLRSRVDSEGAPDGILDIDDPDFI